MASNKLSLLVSFVAVDKLSGALKNIVGLGRRGSQSLNGLRASGRQLEAQLAKVRRELAGSSGNVTALLERERSLERQIERTNAQIQRRARLNAIEADKQAMLRRADALKSKGTSNIYGGIAMAAPFVLVEKLAMDYEKSLALLGQKLDLNKRQQQALGMAMLVTARNAKQLPANVIGAADFLASKGRTVEQIRAMMPAIARFATAWDADIVDSTKAAYAANLSLNVGLADTSKALQIMAAAGKAGGFEVKDMAQYFPELSAGLAALGYKGTKAVGDLSAALQILESKTGNGEQAATNLKNLFAFATSQRGIKRFKQFGVNITAVLKKAAKDGTSPIEAMIVATNKATHGDQMRIGEVISNQEAGSAMRALVQEQKRYLDIRRQALAAQGLTDREFNRMAATSAANWEALKGSATTLAITLGSRFLPTVTAGIDKVTKIANAVAKWADANPRTAALLMQLLAASVAFKVGLGLLQFTLGGILGPAAHFISIIRMMGGLTGIFGAVRTAALFLGSGLLRAGAMMLANPIVLVITAVVAALGIAAYLIYTHWDRIKVAFANGWNFVKGVLSTAVGWMKNIGHQMMQGLLLALNPAALANRLLAIARRGIAAFKSFFGIKSPSRLMMTLGHHTATGLAMGIDRGRRRPMNAMGRMAAGVAAAGALSLTPVGAAAAPAGGARAVTEQAAARTINVTINIQQQPGQSATELAKDVRRELQRLEAVDRRRSYSDPDS